MNEKKLIEKWLKQIKSDEIKPDALGLASNKEKAIEQLNQQLIKLNSKLTNK